MRKRSHTHGRTERGASAVEFALVVPFLILLIIGMVNFGVVLSQQLSLSNAARQAARYAVVDGPTCADVETQARDALGAPGLTRTGPAFVLTGGGCPKPCAGSATRADQNVTVTLRYASTWVVPFPVPGFGSGMNLEGKGKFRCEFS
jgi:Flp pilus assembly protein TadG